MFILFPYGNIIFSLDGRIEANVIMHIVVSKGDILICHSSKQINMLSVMKYIIIIIVVVS